MSNDPIKDFERWDAEQEAKLEDCPICDCCGEHIQDDYYYSINGEKYCEECLDENFREVID